MNAYIFDVDGVLTDPTQKKITEPELLPFISKILDRGDIVAFNTGRSLSWVKDRVTNPLSEIVQDRNLFNHVLIVGEKGASWMEYVDGNWKTGFDTMLSLPSRIKKQIKSLAAEHAPESAFYDESKKAMATIEMKDNYSTDKFAKDQALLLPKIQELLNEYGGKFTIDYSFTDIDIQYKNSGKNLGARRILEWLKDKGIKPQTFITLGDNQSDFEMAEELHKDGYIVEFVFVGKDKSLAEDKSYPVFVSSVPFEKGVREYFSKSL